MKLIERPAPVELNGQAVAWESFIWALVSDKVFMTDWSTISHAAKILCASKKEPMVIDDSAHELLCQAVKNPSQGFAPPSILLYSWFEAILNAKPLGGRGNIDHASGPDSARLGSVDGNHTD
jgi:hypothetical protein